VGRWSWGGKQERHAGGPTPPGPFGHSSRPGVDRIRTVKVQVRGRVRASAWQLFCQTGPPCSVCSDEKERTAAALGWKRGRREASGWTLVLQAGAAVLGLFRREGEDSSRTRMEAARARFLAGPAQPL